MKLNISSSILLLALATPTFASHAQEPCAEKLYFGVFGGGGSSNSINTSQFGTAYYIEAQGGPLAVNAFGQLGSKSTGFFGAQIGYQARDVFLNYSPQWVLRPAAELEGYIMSKSTFNGDLINNTDRLPEHDFVVSYPMHRTVYLINAVLNFKNHHFPVTPYIGLGIGNAIVRISNASATQIDPPEAGFNHYNASTNATDSVFAGQIKLGLSYGINKYISIFADYRCLYLASSNFTFGSTVYPSHPETSSWQVILDAQRYNLGNIGIRFSL